jgi:Cu(I)-responsive transcriptional regulator
MNIGKAAAVSGISVKMIRYYESIGLIPTAIRTDAGYRDYSNEDVHTLRFLRRARDLGFSEEKMTELLALRWDRDRASADVKRVALQHVKELERKARELREMSKTLKRLVENCQGTARPNCPIFDDLAEEADTKDEKLALS